MILSSHGVFVDRQNGMVPRNNTDKAVYVSGKTRDSLLQPKKSFHLGATLFVRCSRLIPTVLLQQTVDLVLVFQFQSLRRVIVLNTFPI